jgi:hypothetical protein
LACSSAVQSLLDFKCHPWNGQIIFKEKDLDVWNGTTFIQRKVVMSFCFCFAKEWRQYCNIVMDFLV